MDTAVLSEATADRAESIILGHMLDRKSFTSVDIANQLKEEGFYARNRMVAEWLRSNAIRVAHDYGLLYNQTLIRVSSKADGMTLAYLYHEHNVDADDYLNRDQNPKPYRQVSSSTPGRSAAPMPNRPSPTTTVVTRTTTTTRQSGHDGWKSQPRDARGRWV